VICSFVHENEVVAPAPDKPLDLEEEETQMKDQTGSMNRRNHFPQKQKILVLLLISLLFL
jgi:hypothetical protein